jgi:hypothetical protein
VFGSAPAEQVHMADLGAWLTPVFIVVFLAMQVLNGEVEIGKKIQNTDGVPDVPGGFLCIDCAEGWAAVYMKSLQSS